jgi:hypothetical protein
MPARIVMGIGGPLTVVGGYYLGRSGARMLESDRHAVDRAIAEQAARTYNERVIGAGISGRF